MRKNIIIGAFALFAFLLLVFTCPNKQDHEEAITYVVSSLINEKIDEEETDALALLGSFYLTKFVGQFLDSRLRVNNYFLFSVGEVNYKGKTKNVSFGILNHVYTIDKEDIKKEISEDK
ncbi:DUF4359 domain-containing protein [Prevotella sp.]|uniref:DUF4359 domain-containing protein n=1 Tax=Prevotella sp. TaxID=59823 RepID=UPI00307B03A6